MKIDILANLLKEQIGGEIRLQEPMREHTTWRIGGPADLLVIPGSMEDFRSCLTLAREQGAPVTVLGNGSNVLVLDGGIRGLVIKTTGGLTNVEVRGERIIAGAGAMLSAAARTAARHGLTGLEFSAGIPGTVGGAVVMNAGTGDACMGDVVEEVAAFTQDGELVNLPGNELTFAYRQSSLQECLLWVAGVVLRLRPGEAREIDDSVRRHLESRRERQPLNWPNAGSVFANPDTWSAGYLIEQAGAKGLTRGGAQVSPVHANFIVNTGGATASDVMWLIEEVRARVGRQFGITMRTEVKILGEG